MNLLEYGSAYQKVITRCFGRFIIVEDDNLAKEIVKKYSIWTVYPFIILILYFLNKVEPKEVIFTHMEPSKVGLEISFLIHFTSK